MMVVKRAFADVYIVLKMPVYECTEDCADNIVGTANAFFSDEH